MCHIKIWKSIAAIKNKSIEKKEKGFAYLKQCQKLRKLYDHDSNDNDNNGNYDTNKWYPANIYLFKVNNRDSRKRFGICSKLTIKVPEQRNWCSSGHFIIDFEHISYPFLVFIL